MMGGGVKDGGGPNRFCIRAVLGQGKVKQGFSFYCGVSFVKLREPG